MKEKIDYYIVPKYTFEDKESNEIYSGKLICTHKCIFMLDENCSLDDDIKIENLLNITDMVDAVDFEAELKDIIAEKFVLQFIDMEIFHVKLGLFSGGINYKLKGKISVNIDIPKRSVRKELNLFYDNVLLG